MKMKRILSILLALSMVFGMGLTAFADNSSAPMTRGEFVAMIADYFGWPHPEDYNDYWETRAKKEDPSLIREFVDVDESNPYRKQIEVAYEEDIIAPDSEGRFNPDDAITRQDAAIIFAKAYNLFSNKPISFSDARTIRDDARSSVSALLELGVMAGKSTIFFKPNDTLSKKAAREIFSALQELLVAPVYALPRARFQAPRRYIKLYTATPGATIYYTRNKGGVENPGDLPEPVDPDPKNVSPTPATRDGFNITYIYQPEYDATGTGHWNEDQSGSEYNDAVWKAVAVAPGKLLPQSAIKTWRWSLYRPSYANSDFMHDVIFEKDELGVGSPAVYEIFNDAESVRAMAWYIEGSESGIIFDALQTGVNDGNLKTYIEENMATKPFNFVLGHNHPDHVAQLGNLTDEIFYVNTIDWNGVANRIPQQYRDNIRPIKEGDVLELGDTQLHVHALPGHADGLILLQERTYGMIFATDIYGCTRAGSADNVAVSGVKADKLLSMAQQVRSAYLKDGGKAQYVYTGHDEFPLTETVLNNFEAALQQVVDYGEDATTPTLRGNNNARNSRTTMVGDMWKDLNNWLSLQIGGSKGGAINYLSQNVENSDGSTFNYNTDDGFTKYSVLSNIEFEGGELVGVDLKWGGTDGNGDAPIVISGYGDTFTAEKALYNKLNPWIYEYTVNVPAENDTITVIPTTMSTKVASLKLDGKEVGYKSRNLVAVKDGSVITVDVVAQDGETTSTYKFTVNKQVMPINLIPEQRIVRPGDTVVLNTKFGWLTASNAAILTYTFNSNLFEYVDFTAAEGVAQVDTVSGEGTTKVTVMIQNYEAENLGALKLLAKSDIQFPNEKEAVKVAAEYVVKTESGGKEIFKAEDTALLYTPKFIPGDTNGDGEVDLIDLSNIIDWFGIDVTDPEWDTLYVNFDTNGNDIIDIHDIAYVAQLIK